MNDALAQLAAKIARMEELTRQHFGTECHEWYNVVEISNSYQLVKQRVERLHMKAERMLAALDRIAREADAVDEFLDEEDFKVNP